MRIRKKSKTLAAGASVALATAGLSSCQDNGAVDPPPPPLECNTVDEGETLSATAVVTGRELRITIRVNGPGDWSAVEVTSVTGGAARPVAPAFPLVIVIDLTDENVRSGAFTLRGTLRSGDRQCAV